jgi:hypothetical protein
MNFDGEFIHIGDIDVSEIKKLILNLSSEQWQLDTIRQDRYTVHADTETISLVWDEDFRHTKPSRLPALEMFSTAIRPSLAKIAAFYESSDKWSALIKANGVGYFIRASFVKLKAGCEIKQHQDKNFSLVHSHRIHIPIITNDDVLFNIGDLSMNILEGEIVEINNRKIHSVQNKSDKDRVHLILDWVIKGEKCCCSTKTHPDTPCDPQVCMKTDRLIEPCNCFDV